MSTIKYNPLVPWMVSLRSKPIPIEYTIVKDSLFSAFRLFSAASACGSNKNKRVIVVHPISVPYPVPVPLKTRLTFCCSLLCVMCSIHNR